MTMWIPQDARVELQPVAGSQWTISPETEVSESTDFFHCLPAEEKTALLFEGERRCHARGMAVLTEGQRGGDVFVVTRGRAAVECVAPSGRRIIVALIQPGGVVGDVAAIDGGKVSATVRALEIVETVSVSGARFRRLLREYPAVADMVLRRLCARLRDADRLLVEFGAGDAVGRVCARVAELAGEHGQVTRDGIRITLPLSQDEMAGYTGLSREAVSRVLSGMRQRGWIRTGRRTVLVHDLEAVRRASRR